MCDIIFDIIISFELHVDLLSDRNIKEIFGNLRLPSDFFGDFREIFGNVRQACGQLLKHLRKFSESSCLSSGNDQKHCYVL